MLVTKFIEIDMGHRVPNHKSKCRNLHGHRYKIEVGVEDKVVSVPGSSDEGMVIDFGDLKQIMVEKIDANYDHGFAIADNDDLISDFLHYKDGLGMKVIVLPFVPTAEKLAEHWYEIIKPKLLERGIKIDFVRVWETPTSTATYYEE